MILINVPGRCFGQHAGPMNVDAQPAILDVRPLFARGEAPCDTIDAAVARLAPEQALELIAPFEPKPLYTKLGRLGFQHEARQASDGAWHVLFRKNPDKL